MKNILKNPGALLILLIVLSANIMFAQPPAPKKHVVIDIAHGQKFYHDPADMPGMDPQFVDRVKYMTGELAKNAASLNGEISFQKTSITPAALATCDLLFIHIPSSKYSADEIKAIQQYLNKGGSIFIVMEADYWSTLEQVNVNDIVSPHGIVFKTDDPNTTSGGHTKPGLVAGKRFEIPFHGARLVEGGTPFCYSNSTEVNPFGVYKEVKNGGKIIAMGDGMVSLYMTSWEGVNNYQCSEFMQDAFAWLLK